MDSSPDVVARRSEAEPPEPIPGSPPSLRRPSGAGRFSPRALGLTPVWALGVWGMVTAGAEAWGRLGDVLAADPASRREVRRVRAWERLAAVLGRLKGAFAKAGQFASVRVDLVPEGARPALAALRDRVPPVPLATLVPWIEDALGSGRQTLFAEIDPEPLGAASVAQAHHARLPDGREVVVKIQYPWLAASNDRDLALIRWVVGLLVRGARRRAEALQLFDEYAAGVREELDFEREARMAAEIAANLASDPQIEVPAVVPSHSARRVLTTAYHPVVSLGDRDGLERLGIRPAAVLEPLARAYAKQVFVDGLFHADPHPGNLFVLADSDPARPRILFVDFGLSKRLAPELRHEMRQGLYALLQGDPPGFLAGMDRMGMIAPGAHAGVERAVRAMFARIREEGAPTSLGGGQVLALKDEAKRLLDETPGLVLPNDLLLYARTLSYLFGLGHELDPDVDLVRVSLPYLLQFLATKD